MVKSQFRERGRNTSSAPAAIQPGGSLRGRGTTSRTPGRIRRSITLLFDAAAGPYYAGLPAPSGGVTLSTEGGVATFGTLSSGTCQSATGVEATVLGSGYTLTATAPGASQPGAISTAFAVVQYDQLCTNSCTAQVTQVTMTFPKQVVDSLANNGTPLVPVCAGAQVPFPGSSAVSGETGTDEYPDVDDTYPYQGLLANCPSGLVPGAPGTSVDFCVASRQKNPGASETVQIYVGSAFTSDPSFW